jgi:hypothetical protein
MDGSAELAPTSMSYAPGVTCHGRRREAQGEISTLTADN